MNKKTILMYSLMFIITLAVIEGIARLANSTIESRWSGFINPTCENATNFTIVDQILLRQQEFAGEYPHPYFGHILGQRWGNKNLPGHFTINNYGFLEDANFPPSHDTYNVAILGGSFAQQMAFVLKRVYSDGNDPELKALMPTKKKIRFYNLALGASKQPQQLNIANYFAFQFDAFINVDGFNEIDAFPNDSFPIDFPYFSQVHFSHDDASAKIKKLERLRGWEKSLVADVCAPEHALYIKKDLSLASLMIVSNILRRGQEDLNLSKTDARFYGHSLSMLEKRTMGAQSWYENSLKQHLLLKELKAPHWFFIQPNQYADEKKLTAYEEQNCIMPIRAENSREGYLMLRKQAEKLKKAGAPIYPESIRAFSEYGDKTLYRDNCCHLNDEGYEIFSRFVLRKVLKDLSTGDFAAMRAEPGYEK